VRAGFEITDDEREALGVMIKMTRSLNAVERGTLGHLGEAELTVSQFGVLDALYHLGPMCQRDVAKKILKSTGNITTVIDNLEKRGLVERKRSEEDRRYIQVHLTVGGSGLYEQVFPGHMQRLEKSFSVLSPAERSELGRLCRKLGLGQG
jgi:MarR family 2-MHQ and catechol resistance regulon transcriptional repressor